MAVHYFCDNCGAETSASGLSVLVISIPPQSETFDVCEACAGHMTAELDRCREVKRERELAGGPTALEATPPTTPAEPLGMLERSRQVVDAIPGATALVRTASYGAIFVAFVALVTFLSTLR